MKKAMKGELPLLQKAQGLQEELLMMMPEEIGDEALAQEKVLVKNAKKIGLLVAGLAAQRFGTKLEAEQEVLVEYRRHRKQRICNGISTSSYRKSNCA